MTELNSAFCSRDRLGQMFSGHLDFSLRSDPSKTTDKSGILIHSKIIESG